MFRHRHRRSAFTDPLNWTDYRWDTGPWQHGGAAGAWGGRRGYGRQRSHPFLLLLIAGIAAVIGARLLASLQSRNTSWARRGLYAVILLVIVNAFRNRRNRWW